MSVPLSKLGLGSAQFRLDAAPSARGRSAEAEVGDILAIAARSGLRVLDILEAASRSITLQGAPVPLRGVPENQGAAPDRGLAGLGSGI